MGKKFDLNKFIPEAADFMKALKTGFLLAVIVFTSLFSTEIKAGMLGGTGKTALVKTYETNMDNRVRDLESSAVANEMVNDMVFEHSKLIDQMQSNQREIATLLDVIGKRVDKMQDREYERLSKGQ